MTEVEQIIKDLERRYSLIMEMQADDNPLLMGAIHGYVGVTLRAISVSPVWHHFDHEEHDKFEQEVCQKFKNNLSIPEETRNTWLYQGADFYFAPAYDALHEVYNKIEKPDTNENLRDAFKYNEQHYQNLLRRIHPVIIGKLEQELTGSQKNEKAPIDKNIKAEFSEEKSSLIIGTHIIALPPYKDEYCLCKALFERLANEPVDWEIVYEEMTGIQDPKDQERAKKKVSDTSRRVNARVKEMADIEDFLVWEVKTVRRRY